MDPRKRFESDDLSWLAKPDSEVESQWIERKEKLDVKAVAEALCDMANGQPPGGLVVVGVSTNGGLTGVDRQEVEQQLGYLHRQLDACGWERRFVSAPSPGLEVLFLYVPFSANKVVRKADRSVFRRVGSQTLTLRDEEVQDLLDQRGERRAEEEIVGPLTGDALDAVYAQRFLDALIARNGPTRPTTIEQALVNRHLAKLEGGVPMLKAAAVLAMGRTPAASHPGARLRFVRFEGTARRTGTQLNLIKDRFFEGPIPRIVEDFRAFMRDQVRDFEWLGPDGRFVREPEYPEAAWLEGVVNALAHRSYSLKNAEVVVSMYDDRLEIQSPGGFPGTARPDARGVIAPSQPRNPHLAEALLYMSLVVKLGEGTQRIAEEMERLKLPLPVLRETGTFVVLALHNDVDRRKQRTGAEESRARWEKIREGLASDLAIYWRHALTDWRDASARGAVAAADVVEAADRLVRSLAPGDSLRQSLVEIMANTPSPEARAKVAAMVDELLRGGILGDGGVVAALMAASAASDEIVASVLSALEGGTVVAEAVPFALSVLTFRVRDAKAPPERRTIDRILAVCLTLKERGEAQSLYQAVTGRSIS